MESHAAGGSEAAEARMGAIWGGVRALLVSQLANRLLTFCLNLAVARLLTPEQYGLLAVQASARPCPRHLLSLDMQPHHPHQGSRQSL